MTGDWPMVFAQIWICLQLKRKQIAPSREKQINPKHGRKGKGLVTAIKSTLNNQKEQLCLTMRVRRNASLVSQRCTLFQLQIYFFPSGSRLIRFSLAGFKSFLSGYRYILVIALLQELTVFLDHRSRCDGFSPMSPLFKAIFDRERVIEEA